MFLSYQMLRNLAPEGMTADHQRATDEQLGGIVAALARHGRLSRRAAVCQDSGAGHGGRPAGQISKGDRELRRAVQAARCAS